MGAIQAALINAFQVVTKSRWVRKVVGTEITDASQPTQIGPLRDRQRLQ